MEKFTKGPWRVSVCFVRRTPLVQRGMSGGFYVTDDDDLRAIADANLIASAPEMYEMLKSVAANYANSESLISEIERLLAKARGEQ